MKKVKWGVIDCGQISVDKTIPAIVNATNAQLAAVSDMRPDRLRLVQQQVDDVQTYAASSELLGSAGIDAVYVALPNSLHCPVTLEAARHGKHILCEKPLALEADEARRMIDACRESGVKLMTAYMARFGDVFTEAKRALESDRLGRITMINANFSYGAHRFYTPDKDGFWRWTGKRAGPLLDAGVYLAFTIRELLNSRPARVSAGIWPVIAHHSEVSDTVVAWFALEDGTPGVMSTTYSHNESSIKIHGETGSLGLSNCFAQTPSGALSLKAGKDHVRFQAGAARVDHFEHYRREVEHFSDAILNHRDYRPAPEEALADMRFLDAVEESAHAGRAVEINYQDDDYVSQRAVSSLLQRDRQSCC
jgi:D-xylose 1-dehydrogenase (NADP+, D-xylono-1,5-lactone-forming)